MADIVKYDPNDSIVANRVTEYLRSVHTPDYEGQANILINPDVPDCPLKYWKKCDGNKAVEMTTGEKSAVDQAEQDALDLAETNAKNIDNLEKSVKVLAKLTFKEINKLRAEAGLSEYTWIQFKAAFVAEWDA